MNADPAAAASRGRPESAATEVCLLLACFRGAKSAARARGKIGKELEASGDGVLDEVVLRVDARQRARVYDPRRVAAGTLTSALTWGVFGLLTGGVASGGLWAIIGAVCGGLFAYYTEHLLSKDELKRIGARLPGDSSAIAAFVCGGDPRQVLAAAAQSEPAQASVAAVDADLSARVLAGAAMPVETSSAPGGRQALQGRADSTLSMLLVRYRGDRTAAREVSRHRREAREDPAGLQTELIFEASDHGRLKVSDPAQGVWAFAKSDLVSWGLFGLVYGLIVGLVSNHGIFAAVKDTAGATILCAVFGLAAGALYGLWAGRGVSARRMKRVRPLLPRDTSTVLAWSEEDLTKDVVGDWAEPGSELLVVRFNPVADGALLEV